MNPLALAIAGGGPAGLAAAIEAASRGHRARVIERRTFPYDKACGEGLMPSGVAWLERSGVLGRIGPEDCSPFRGVRYVQEDGSAVEGALPRPGLGVRRLALVAALRERALELGVELWDSTHVRGARLEPDAAVLDTDRGEVRAPLLVAADGLHSPLRRQLGLGHPSGRAERRFGVRRHFAVPPWSPFVEVHLSAGAEAYVTPVGRERVGVAFLWQQPLGEGRASFEVLLRRFPLIARRVEGAGFDSTALGAGPFLQRARAVQADRVLLLGDAAGYVDAITGEGLSLAFASAARLGELLGGVLEDGRRARALAEYARWHRGAFRRYAVVARGLLGLSRHPRARRRAMGWLAANPRVFERLLGLALA